MSGQVAIQTPSWRIDPSHSEDVLNTYSSITTPPFKNALHHFIPYFGGWSRGSVELSRNDPIQEAMLPSHTTNLILNEIDLLSDCASLRRKPVVHTTLNHHLSQYGSKFSITRPVILIPYHLLFRQGKNPFTQETPQDQLSGNIWQFTDDETRFLISRQIAHIGSNHNLFRLALKIALFIVLFFLYSQPLSLFLGLLLGTFAAGCYLVIERSYETTSDLAAVALLSRRFNNITRAHQAAFGALEKMRLQNCARWHHSLLCRLYITRPGLGPRAGGDNWLDLNHDKITSRIQRISQQNV